jgi:integrase
MKKMSKAFKFTDADIEILKKDKYKAVWMGLLTMGLRISELKQLDYDTCLSNEILQIKSSKGSNSKIVKLTSLFKDALSTVNKETWDYYKQIDRTVYNRRLKRLLNRVGGVSTHSFRKTIANKYYIKYNDILRVKNILGHKSLSSTSYYLESNYIIDSDEVFI